MKCIAVEPHVNGITVRVKVQEQYGFLWLRSRWVEKKYVYINRTLEWIDWETQKTFFDLDIQKQLCNFIKLAALDIPFE